MELLVLLVLLAVPIGLAIGLASVFVEVWRAFRDKKRSIATSIAITCIVAFVPIVFAANYFETQPPSGFGKFLETVGIVVMYCAGISGCTGLVWDRRIARLQSMDSQSRQHRLPLPFGSGGESERSMSDSQPEADEQLFQKVRNELLGKAEDKEVAPPAAPPEDLAAQARAQAQRQRLLQLVVVLAVLGAIASALGWLDPVSFRALKSVGLVMLAVIGVGLLVSRLQQKVGTRRAQLPPAAPPPAPSPWRRLLLSFVWFVLLGVLLFTPVELAWLIGVLLLHESGHFLGMRYFGYRDLQMFFIPLFGAAVRGEKRGVPAWQEAMVLLLGPLPGLILGCGIYFLDLAAPQPILRTGATWLVAINFLNLLPFEPLDGGRFCNRLLFSRFRWLEAVTVVLATVGLVFVCWGPGWIGLALSGGFALFVLAPARYKTATAAAALQSRWPDLPPQPADLREEQWRDLFTITRGQFGSNTKLLAGQMKNVHTRALQHPESGGATFGLFALYLTALLLGIVTASVTRLGEDTGRWPIRIKHQVSGSVDGAPSPAD